MHKIGVFLVSIAMVRGFAQDIAGYTLAKEGKYRITVHRVDCGPKDSPSPFGCRVRYSYQFENRESVYIAELGEVPPAGEFDYVTKETRITFLESPNPEAVIAFIDVTKTAITRGAPLPKFPSFRDFPQDPMVVGEVRTKSAFLSRAQRVFQAAFGSRYDPDWTKEGVRYLITDYTNIKGPHDNVRLKVAVMISNPEPFGKATGFRIRWIAREKNKNDDETDWREPESDSESHRLVKEFVDALGCRLAQK